jgi:exosortase/archaeosortase family protein
VQPSRKQGLVFFATFLALAAALSLIYSYPYARGSPVEQWVAVYLGTYAGAVGRIVRFTVDPSVRVLGQGLFGRFSIRIVRDCDGMQAMILYASGVLAFGARWLYKLAGLVVGFLFIATANVIRLCSMYEIGIYWPNAFDFVHRDFWPTALVVFAIVVFLRWCQWVTSSEPNNAHST